MSAALSNIEAEAALIGALMIDWTLVDSVADKLTSLDFHEPVHARIFAAIVHQASIGKPTTAMLLRPQFEHDEGLKQLGGMVYLARLTGDASGLLSLRQLSDQIADLAQRRRMKEGLNEAIADCGDFTLTHAEIVSRADAALSTTGEETIHQPTGGQCFDELIDGFGDKTLGVTCGTIPSLDAILGEMRPKQLVIGAGRPGMGKTALALSYALGAAQRGHGVLFVSLEMSSRELAARMAADLCFQNGEGVPYSAIRDGDLNDWQNRRVAQAGSFMHGLPFNVVDAGNLTTGRLNMLVRRHARRMAAKGQKLELVIIDYLQLLSPDSKGRSNYEAVSEVSRALKAIAKDHSVAVFALAQLSREVEKRPDKRPQLSDLRDSGQIEQDADAVLFLLRPEYYLNQAEPAPSAASRAQWEAEMDMVKGQIEFIIAKRRNGVIGNACGNFHGMFQAVRG